MGIIEVHKVANKVNKIHKMKLSLIKVAHLAIMILINEFFFFKYYNN